MKHCINNKIALSLLLMFFALVQGAWAEETSKKTPSVSFSSENVDALIAQQLFSPPSIKIQESDGKTNIRNKFVVRYKIDGSNLKSDSTDNDGHIIYKDLTTGTAVNSYTGLVTIGGKAAGDVKITATATPSEMNKKTYEGGTATYTIHIKSPALSAYRIVVYTDGDSIKTNPSDRTQSAETYDLLTTHNQNNQSILISSSQVLSGLQIYYVTNGGRKIDVTERFDVAVAAENNSYLTVDKDDKGNYTVKSTFSGTNVGDNAAGDIVFTATPKKDYQAVYGSDLSVPLTVHFKSTYYPSNLSEENKIKTYVVYDNKEAKFYRYPDPNHVYHLQVPRIVDEYGNDVSAYYKNAGTTCKPLNSFKYSDDPWDWGSNFKDVRGVSVNQQYIDYRSDNSDLPVYGAGLSNLWLQPGRPDDYVITANLQVSGDFANVFVTTPSVQGKNGAADQTPVLGMFYGKGEDTEYKDSVHINPGQYVLHIHKRVPTLYMNPDPNKVSVAENFVLNRYNRFELIGRFHDEIENYNDSIVLQWEKSNGKYKGTEADGFEYYFFVPDELAYDKTKTLSEGSVAIEFTDAHGKPIFDPQLKNSTIQDTIWTSPNSYWVQPINYDSLGVNISYVDQVHPGVELYLQEYNTDGTLKFDANGNPVRTKKRGTIYYEKYHWNNDDMQIFFHGTGKVPLFYSLHTWNPTRWDVCDFQTFVFNSVKQQPVEMRINPTEYVIHKGETAPEPEVTIWDTQFNIDVTKYYNTEWTKGDDAGNVITFNEKDHTSLGNNIGGPIDISVSGKQKDANDLTEYSTEKYPPAIYQVIPDNSPVHYTVQVLDDKVYFDVIYDDTYYTDKTDGNSLRIPGEYDNTTTTKMGKLHFVDEDENITEDGISFIAGQGTGNLIAPPGMNVTFGAANDFWLIRKGSREVTDGEFDRYKDSDSPKAIDAVADQASFASTETETNEENMVVTYGEDGKFYPVRGGFLKLQPYTNGFLQIDADFGTKEQNFNYYLIDVDAITTYLNAPARQKGNLYPHPDVAARGVVKNANGTENTGEFFGERRFPYALLAGHTYYLFSDGGAFFIHGLTYMPAFVVMHEDKEPAKSATLFVNSGFSGDLPMVVNSNRTTAKGSTAKAGNVDFSLTFNDDDWSESKQMKGLDGGTTTLKATDVIELQNGYQPVGKKYTMADNRVRVRASVTGASKKYSDKHVERAPYMDVASVGIPMYKVGNSQEGLQPGTRVTTTNFVTRMWMTWGGWNGGNEDEDYPYYKDNDSIKNENLLIDQWNTAVSDTVGRDGMTIDGFKYASNGNNNPTDENVRAFSSYGMRGYFKDWSGAQGVKGSHKNHRARDPFNLPVRGDYYKFEPEESGTLMVYLLQNGMTDLDNNRPDQHLDSKPWELRRRSVYIVDENGDSVSISDKNDNWTKADGSMSLSDAMGEKEHLTSSHYNYMTEGILRCTWNTTGENANPLGTNLGRTGANEGFNFSRFYSEYPGGDSNLDLKADVDSIKKYWEPAKFNQLMPVFKLKDGSFAVPTKAYVRYTFPVKSGKTYYVFMNGSKLGFCGFAFVPEGFMKNASKWPECKDEETDAKVRAGLPEPDNSNTGDQVIYNQESTTPGHVTITLREGSKDDPKPNVIDGTGAKDEKTNIGSKAVEFVNVNLKRTINNKEWTSICLPFSVNEPQVKKIFGDNALVITFDSVMTEHKFINSGNDTTAVDERTAHFTRHVIQNIIAGKPYFIKPSVKDVEEGKPIGTKLSDGEYQLEFKHVSVEAVPAKTDSCWNYGLWWYNDLVDANKSLTKEKKDSLKKNMFTYRFTGIYDRQQIPWYSYVMGTTTKDGNVQNGLYRITSTKGPEDPGEMPYLKGYRAFLYPLSADVNGDYRFKDDGELAVTDGTSGAKADITNFWITGGEVIGDSGDGTTTDIEQLVQEMNTMLTEGRKGVYNLQGMLVRHDNDLSGLPAGVYIMNGKKYLIK